MMNNSDFEKLVFERAEELKAHDRRVRAVRLSILPIAAAFVILTSVGLRSALTVPNSSTAQDDRARDSYTAENYSGSAEHPADLSSFEEEDTQKAADDMTAYNDNAVDYAADAAPQLPEDEAPAVTAVILTQEKTVVTDAKKVSALENALTGSEETSDGGVCLGTVTFSDSEMLYKIYNDHFEVYHGGTLSAAYAYTDGAEDILSEYFPM